MKRSYLPLWDLFLTLVAPVLALYLRDADFLFRAHPETIGYYWTASAALTLLAMWAFRLQDGVTRHFSLHETLDIAEALLITELASFVMLFTTPFFDGIPRSIPLIHGILVGTGLVGARLVMRGILSGHREARSFRYQPQRIIVIGANRFAAEFVQMLQAFSPDHQPVIAILDDNSSLVGQTISGVRVLGTSSELESIITEFSIHGVAVEKVVVAGEADLLSTAVLHEVEQICKRHKTLLCFLPRMIGLTDAKSPSPSGASAGTIPIETQIHLSQYFRFKRLIDVVGSLLLILILLPIVTAATLLVLLDVGRPVLFWQERLGWQRRSFLIYKFRTLSAPFDSAGCPLKNTREPSKIGQFLRATRIDELPQLLNVLLGDMSLIGPRPLLPADQPTNTSVRLSVRPGISGWAQVNGAKLLTKEQKELLDEWYVRNASLRLDCQIALLTLSLMTKTRLGSAESLADKDQVRARNSTLAPTISPSIAANTRHK